MAEMAERVSKAIYASEPLFMCGLGMDINTLKQVPWDDLDDRDRADALDAARAAIAAMREPTEEMIEAAMPVLVKYLEDSLEFSDRDAAIGIWQAMVGSAL